jgi:hypothetical protein
MQVRLNPETGRLTSRNRSVSDGKSVLIFQNEIHLVLIWDGWTGQVMMKPCFKKKPFTRDVFRMNGRGNQRDN